jgi:hypothetical protein
MTISDLHSITNFADLQNDPRFVGLMLFLRRNSPKATSHEAHGMIQDSGKLAEFNRILELVDQVFRPKAATSEPSTYIPYSDETRNANKPTHV